MNEEQAAPEPVSQEVQPETPEVQKTEEIQVEKKEEVQPEKLVRLEALHEERGKRKELARQLEQEKQARAAFEATMQERMNQLYHATQPQQRPPDPDDPIALHDHELAQHRQFLQGLANKQAQEEMQARHVQAQQALVSWARGEAEEFKKQTPDFDGAYKHVVAQRTAQLRAMGLSPPEANEALIRDELWVYSHAKQTGKNPGEVIYEMAKNTGYKPNGSSPEQKMDALQKGVEASKGLANGSPPSMPSPQQIADMSPSQFNEFKAKLQKKGLRLSDVL